MRMQIRFDTLSWVIICLLSMNVFALHQSHCKSTAGWHILTGQIQAAELHIEDSCTDTIIVQWRGVGDNLEVALSRTRLHFVILDKKGFKGAVPRSILDRKADYKTFNLNPEVASLIRKYL